MNRKARNDGFVLEDALAPFRSREQTEDVIILLDDDDAIRVIVAWQKTDQQWSRPSGKMPPAVIARLEQLWTWVVSGWEIDARKIARLTGLTVARAHEKIEMIVGNRLVYPDGSLSKAARTAVMRYTATKLGIKSERKNDPQPAKADEIKSDKTNDVN